MSPKKFVFTIFVMVMLFAVNLSANHKLQTQVGFYQSTNHGFQEFVGLQPEYTLQIGLGGTKDFELQAGASYWRDDQVLAGKSYSLTSLQLPFRFLYLFHPNEKWQPFFGAGTGFQFLQESHINTEIFGAFFFTLFCGFNYMLSPKWYVNSEVVYSYAYFQNLDGLSVEGASFRVGVGRSF